MIHQKRILYTITILLVLVSVGALGYRALNKRIPAPSSTSSEPTSSVSPENQTISLKNIPITFELSRGYAIFQREGFEGDYATTITVGKEISAGHFEYAPLGIELRASAYDMQGEIEYSPKEYVDVIFEEQKNDSASNPQYIKLFGNEAVMYTNAADDSISIVGYIRADQLPELSSEYLVRISSATYGSGVAPDKELFDTVVDSLRIRN